MMPIMIGFGHFMEIYLFLRIVNMTFDLPRVPTKNSKFFTKNHARCDRVWSTFGNLDSVRIVNITFDVPPNNFMKFFLNLSVLFAWFASEALG